MLNPIDQPWIVEDCKCGDPICTSAQIPMVVTGQGVIKRELANHIVELHNGFLKRVSEARDFLVFLEGEYDAND